MLSEASDGVLGVISEVSDKESQTPVDDLENSSLKEIDESQNVPMLMFK